MNRLIDRPRLLGLVCAAAAVGLGLAYMAAAGAPPLYLAINLAALILGAAAWLGLGPQAGARLAGNGSAVLALTLPLIATALLGVPVDGASRWVSVGPLNLQVSLIVVPAMIILFARGTDAIGAAGIAVAALALAIQPDRAMAGVLAAGTGAILLTRRGPLPALAFATAAVGFGAAFLRPDSLPAVPFVDRILYTAFDVHALAGLAVVAGSLILVAPALVGARGKYERPPLAAFGACWAAAVAAAALGDYPTPLVGYGGSAVLGYLLSVALLPAAVRSGLKAEPGEAEPHAPWSADTGSVEQSILNRV